MIAYLGGAGEGIQTLNPENPVRNKNEVKTDATLPAYCNPPNPCPVGYTGKLKFTVNNQPTWMILSLHY